MRQIWRLYRSSTRGRRDLKNAAVWRSKKLLLLLPAAPVFLQLLELTAHHRVGRIKFERLFQIRYGRRVIHLASVSETDQRISLGGLRIELQVHSQECDGVIGPALNHALDDFEEGVLAEIISGAAVILLPQIAVLVDGRRAALLDDGSQDGRGK